MIPEACIFYTFTRRRFIDFCCVAFRTTCRHKSSSDNSRQASNNASAQKLTYEKPKSKLLKTNSVSAGKPRSARPGHAVRRPMAFSATKVLSWSFTEALCKTRSTSKRICTAKGS